MESDNILIVLGIAALIASVVGLLYAFSSANILTGFATSQSNATVNITITSVTAINFTTNNIDFGSGAVTIGTIGALLSSSGTGSVSNGSWTPVGTGFVLENIGGTNVTLDIRTLKTNATFIGGTGPSYKYNVTNIEGGSCVNASGFNLAAFYDVNTTSPGTRVCSVFPAIDISDRIRIDLQLFIPSDTPNTGALGDTMIATATGA